ncbi:PilZ domain-containing protein [Devosia sp. SD17-2]|uniref:PilZ domain-containing protein n=1 Tax=Devosia sp. SD17-2 TaxID=2976459 RepID=UPI0023D89E9F|nr:PilZ domain-containing protein [Devosia sp. SD17-2]WEJ32532.1 PilZ domain-containing protein [Devosia sp. SD17-2]
MTEERRKSFRRRTLKGGKIVINSGYSTFDCSVRNLSDEGAKLIIAGIIGIPDHFDLEMDDGKRLSCEVIWRTEAELGVKFLP